MGALSRNASERCWYPEILSSRPRRFATERCGVRSVEMRARLRSHNQRISDSRRQRVGDRERFTDIKAQARAARSRHCLPRILEKVGLVDPSVSTSLESKHFL